MGQVCGKASVKDGRDLQARDVEQVVEDQPAVQVVGSWQVPSKPPLGRSPLSPNSQPSKKQKKAKAKKDKERKGFRGTLDAWSSFGSFNGSINERQGKEKRVGILGFEVANLVMKMMNLRMALFEEELARFKEEVILAEASKKLISEDEGVLWTIAALDKRRELGGLMMDVARLGKQSGDPDLQKLDKKFASLGLAGEVRPKLSPSEVDANIEWLQEQIASTADLYHELLALDTVNNSLRRAQAEEEQFPGTQKESLAALKQEAKEQERLVRGLKKKGLWSKKLDHILEVLVELVYALYEQLIDAFYPDVMEETLRPHPRSPGSNNELGVQGLSLHYANVISAIDRMVSRPNSVSPASRDALYQMLPQGIKANLREEISKPLEDDSIAGIRRNLDVILDVVIPVAGNTVRWCSDRRLQGHSDLCLMQTLHHADQSRTEQLLLDLVVNLHHLMARAKNPLNPSGKSPNRTPSRSPIQTPPRVFPAQGGGDDVAEALEAIPAHLRADLEPNLVDRAETFLAKLDAFRTDHFRVVQVAEIHRTAESERTGLGATDRTAGTVPGVEADGFGVESIRTEEGLQSGDLGGVGRKEWQEVERAADNDVTSAEEAGAAGVRSNGVAVTSSHRTEEMPRGDAEEPLFEKVEATASRGREETSAGVTSEEPSEVTSAGAPGMTPTGASEVTSAEPSGVTSAGASPREEPEKLPYNSFTDPIFRENPKSPPGWGLGLLRKSMSAKLEAAKSGKLIERKPSIGAGNDHRGREGGVGFAENRPVDEQEGPGLGMQILHKSRSDGRFRLEDADVDILPKGWHPADRILEGEEGHRIMGLRDNHNGLREVGTRHEREEGSGINGPLSSGNVNGLGSHSRRLSSNRTDHAGLSGNFVGDGGVVNPGLRSEVSLADGLGFRSARVSSEMSEASGLGPQRMDGYDLELGTPREANGHALTGLTHGFGSELQIGEIQAEGFEEHRVESHGGTHDQSGAHVGPSPALLGDVAKLTHRTSDPGASRSQTMTSSQRSQSYSGQHELPPSARKSRFSSSGAVKMKDGRSSSETNLHGFGQPPPRKDRESRQKHSGDLSKYSGELKKHSGELHSPGGSKRFTHEVLGSPRTPRRSSPSPNSRSFGRKTSSKANSPGSSFGSPRSMEPLSPAGVIDIDLIDI